MKQKLKGLMMLFFILILQSSIAQEKKITGVVSDNAGIPLPGVSVLVKGTKLGTQTDFDGKYMIKASSNQVLVFSYIGMKTSEITANSSVINVKMLDAGAQELESVVVTTAMGIKKQKRSLGYATSSVSAKDLTDVTNVNVFESLSGKVAGADITTPAQAGASSKVVIRGFNSLSNSSPLYVVDGTPINNSSNGGGTTADGKSINSTRSFDAGNGISDLDPNNIESMSILKGAAASALYGSRAANGVVLITTKSAKNKSKISIDFLTSTDFNQVARVPHLQNEFGQGWSGLSYSTWSGVANANNTASNENGSWGAKYNGEVRPWGAIINGVQQAKPYVALPSNIKDFYTTGTTFTNSMRISGGGENSNFSLNASTVNSDGIFPTTADAYKRNTLGINAGISTGKFTVRTSVNYINKNQNVVNTGQGGTEGGTVAQALAQTPRDIDVVGLKDYKNNPYNTPSNLYSPYVDNPYWDLQENSTNIKGNRFFGNVNLSYKITDKLTATYQIGGDYRNEKIKSYGAIMDYFPGSANADASKAPVVGGVTEKTAENIETDTNFNLTYVTPVGKDFSFNGMIGFNTNQRSGSSLKANVTNLDVPNFYELSNSILSPIVVQDDYLRRSYGVFASVEASYKEKIYLTVTGRNDWTSTLPQGKNSYFYPSLSLSGVVLDNTQHFVKLRGSIASIGNDTGYYQTKSSMIPANAALGFGNILLPIGGVNGYELSGNLGNPNLKPERTTEYELGFESNFFNKRVNLDFSVYHKKTTDLLFSRPLAASTGFTSQTDNILDLQNRGVEVVLNVVPVKVKKFQWDFTTTFSKNVSKVLDIAYGLDKLTLASMYGVNFVAEKGQPLGMFTAFTPRLTPDGRPIVSPSTGYYTVGNDQSNVGTSQRKFVMGLRNNFKYKNFTLGSSFDWKQGGKMYSYTKRINEFSGNGIETTFNDRNTYIIPNSVIEVKDATGNITYAENTVPMTTSKVTSFWNTSSNPGIEAGHVIDKTFIRLRDLFLTYNVPTTFVQKFKIATASLSIYGKNLFMWTPKANPYVDPELSTYGDGLLSEAGEFATNPSQRSYGASFKVTF
ncbi:TonB-linked outer membrane protein, SusC/RagA family [Flavobacterium anhuiense]|uniref:TonB-linked outer membrane protein, SusC/RagA family n=1 Tax=Flavobacterium anhuiense TaxID=459526 RepID=A0ABY0M0M5_9FLAO|nr:SusC/RagA family TonB-linked outer membrane protein [Flavobacterium anhuiense]SCY86030.1 TonB-linked outer membrane protein, SusC/RagA family [Flavobacterium anhuiense]